MKNLITSKDLLLFYDKNNKLILGGKSSENKKLTLNKEKAKTYIKELVTSNKKTNVKKEKMNKPANSSMDMIKQRTLLVATAGNKKQKAGFIRGSTVPFDPIDPVIPSDKN